MIIDVFLHIRLQWDLGPSFLVLPFQFLVLVIHWNPPRHWLWLRPAYLGCQDHFPQTLLYGGLHCSWQAPISILEWGQELSNQDPYSTTSIRHQEVVIRQSSGTVILLRDTLGERPPFSCFFYSCFHCPFKLLSCSMAIDDPFVFSTTLVTFSFVFISRTFFVTEGMQLNCLTITQKYYYHTKVLWVKLQIHFQGQEHSAQLHREG